jgi:hypothetical protein
MAFVVKNKARVDTQARKPKLTAYEKICTMKIETSVKIKNSW